jgi:hypothetical protein
MPGFLDLLRGGLDTVGGIRAAKDKADETDLVNSANFMMRLRALQQQEADRAAQARLRDAQTIYYEHRPDVTGIATPKVTPPARKHYIFKQQPDGTFIGVNSADPSDTITTGIKGRLPLQIPRMKGGMTAGQQATNAAKYADAMLEQFDGDRTQAENFLANDPNGQEFAKRGVTSADLFAAEGRYRARQAGAAGRIESSGMAPSPEAAAGAMPRLRTPRTGTHAGGVVAGSSTAPGSSQPPPTASGRPDLSALQAKWDRAAESLKSQGKQDAEIAGILGARP